MTHVVGHAYQRFIEGLEKNPMKLNEMRIMKEPNYSKLRSIIRDPRVYGDAVMRAFAEKSELVGVPTNSFHMIHEGFWDLYCKKPATPDLTAKKLDGWINRILLKVPVNAPADDDAEDAGPPGLPVKAVVRVRVPFKRPEVTEGAEGEEPPADTAPKDDAAGTEEAGATIEEKDLEEIDYEDRILSLPT